MAWSSMVVCLMGTSTWDSSSNRKNINKKTKKPSLIRSILNGLGVFMFVSFLWLFFKLPNINHVIGFFDSIFSNIYMYNYIPMITYTIIYSSPVILYHIAHILLKNEGIKHIFKKIEFIPYGILLFLIFTNSGTVGSFIYFQF